MKPDFVFFDVGGVVIKDFSCTNKWEEMTSSMGIRPELKPEFRKIWDKYEHEICIDRSIESLVPILKNKFNLNLSPDFSFTDQFINRFEPNKQLWPVVQQIHKSCRIGLLTNMYPNMFTAIKAADLLPEIKWDMVIDSSVEGLQKPDIEIFKLAQQKANSTPEKILFVENSPGHLENPKKLGWKTFLYDSCDYETSTKKLASYLNNYLSSRT